MKFLKLLSLSLMLLLVAGAGQVFALQFDGTAPTISTGNTTVDDAVNPIISSYFDTALDEANSEIENIKSKQSKLATAFGTANAHVSHAATQRSYPNYDLFAITVGSMMSVRVPSIDPNEIQNIGDDIQNDGDVELGLAWQVWSAQVGINTSKLLLEGLYVSLKFGMLEIDGVPGADEFKADSFTIGALVDYSIFKERSLFGIVKWRGLMLSSGVIYESNKIDYTLEIDDVSQSFDLSAASGGVFNSASVIIDPSVDFGIHSSSIVVPVEVNTAVRLLWLLNLSLGAGVDFNFGKTDIILKSGGDVRLGGDLEGVAGSDGNVSLDASTKDEWNKFVTPKLMAGVGFSLGPVIIDMPATWYITKGFSIGLTAGIVW